MADHSPLTPRQHESNNFTNNRVARSSHRYDNMRASQTFLRSGENAGYTKNDIIGTNRKHPLALVRQIAIWLAREDGIGLCRGFRRYLNEILRPVWFHRVKAIGMLSYNDSELMEVMEKMEVAT